MEPTNEYLRNILRFVSSPDRNRSMTEAKVAIPYKAGDVASNMCPVSANMRLSSAPWKSPDANSPSPKPIPPSAHGPITMPAASSPRMDGSLSIDARAPPSLAANMIIPICSTRNIISSTRGSPKFGYGGGPPSWAANTQDAASAAAMETISRIFLMVVRSISKSPNRGKGDDQTRQCV